MPTTDQLDKLAKEIWIARGRPDGTDIENWKLAEYFQKAIDERNTCLDRIQMGKRFSETLLIQLMTDIPAFIVKMFAGSNLYHTINARIANMRTEWSLENKNQ